MKINSVENYSTEKNLKKPDKFNVDEQEPLKENDLEALNSDFLEMEKDYSEIIDNPQASQEEKAQASIWRSRGKSFLYQGLALLSLAAPLKATGQTEFSSDSSQIKNEIMIDSPDQATSNLELKKYKEFGLLMAYNLASEKPTDYQAEQIKKLEDDIISDLNGRKFSSITEIAAYINNSISSDFSGQESTIYIKDAFPVEPGANAKGSFDCDTRSLISLSILNRTGVTSEQVVFCLLEGHALLNIKTDDTFLEMTNNNSRELDKDEYLQLDRIDSLDKYKAYLLGKEGTALVSEATGNIFRGERDDDEKINLALNKLITAVDLDPNNLTNNLNLLTTLKKIKYRESNDELLLKELLVKASENIKRGLLNNYYEINTDEAMGKTFVLKVQEINSQKIEPRSLEDLGSVEDLTARALSENDYLSRKFIELASDLFYDFKNPEAALPIFEVLAKGENNKKEKKKSSEYCFYKGMVADCYFNLKEYDKYLGLSENELYMLLSDNMKSDNKEQSRYFEGKFNEENLKTTAANVMTRKIVINEETVADFCKNYKDDPLFSGFISGKQHWNIEAIDAVEALKSWPGFENMIKTLDDWKKNKISEEQSLPLTIDENNSETR